MTSAPAPVIDKASEKSQATLMQLISWIQPELDPDAQILWQSFLECDESFEGKLDREELKKMLKLFDLQATDATIEEYVKSILGDTGKEIAFVDLLEWWDKSSKEGKTGLQSLLLARFAGNKVKQYSGWNFLSGLIVKPAVARNMENLTEKAIQSSIPTYDDILAKVLIRRVNVADAALDADEDSAIKAYDERKKGETAAELDDNDRYKLQKLFLVNAGRGNTLSQKKLGDIALCLGVDLPSSILRMTARKYPEPMKEEDYFRWCSARGYDSASTILAKAKRATGMGGSKPSEAK